MWILIRLVVALIALGARFLKREFPLSPTTHMDGVALFEKVQTNKQKKVTGFRIGVALPELPRFRIQAERTIDRLAKALGLVTEFQTGDQGFDQDLYIACDHPGLLHPLRDQARIRELVRKVFADGFSRIRCDDEMLWLERKTHRGPMQYERELLLELRNALSPLTTIGRWWKDPYVARVIAIEAVIWSLVGYAIAALTENALDRGDTHLNGFSLLPLGLSLALILFLILFGATVVLLRQSSWSHRVLVEAALALGLSLPMIGIQTVSDLNRGLDHSETVMVQRPIEQTERRKHRRSTSYYLVLGPASASESIALPRKVRVSYALYSRARAGGNVVFELGRGRLGLPWYRDIRILD